MCASPGTTAFEVAGGPLSARRQGDSIRSDAVARMESTTVRGSSASGPSDEVGAVVRNAQPRTARRSQRAGGERS